jgi:hypothetical protein
LYDENISFCHQMYIAFKNIQHSLHQKTFAFMLKEFYVRLEFHLSARTQK